MKDKAMAQQPLLRDGLGMLDYHFLIVLVKPLSQMEKLADRTFYSGQGVDFLHMKTKRKKAAALRYDHDSDYAPRVTAAGKGLIAETIIEKAKENQVPIQEDPSLVELLGELNINEKIPEELYQAVAEVFAFVYKVDRGVIGEQNE